MLDAAHQALTRRSRACAPVGPRHQACYRYGEAHSTSYSLLSTAWALKRSRKAGRVGIIDLSQDAARGSADIIARLPDSSWLKHLVAATLPCRSDADIAALPDAGLELADCDVVLCQASVDGHCDDVAGGCLDTQQLYQRDLQVLGTAREWCIPMVLTLGAGHQRDELGKLSPLLALHNNTLRAAAKALAG